MDINLQGMTVNERLYALGLMDKFDIAIRNRDTKSATTVLMDAEFTEEQALETLAIILNSPESYGY